MLNSAIRPGLQPIDIYKYIDRKGSVLHRPLQEKAIEVEKYRERNQPIDGLYPKRKAKMKE
jgi:hypothetical protein